MSVKQVNSYFPKNDPNVSFNAPNASSMTPEVFCIIPVVLDDVPVVILLIGVNMDLVTLSPMFSD